MRLVAAVKAGGIVLLALHLHHRLHGPTIDYVTLVAATAASWVGIPGPGEPVLIAAGVFAARHSLDIGGVLLVAWAGATVGGVAGWIIGRRAGRAVLTTRGPLHAGRRKALARGEEVFGRSPVLGILLTPSWIPGILGVRGTVYLPTNALGALIWAVGIGLGAFLIGPPVVDIVEDVGWITVIAIVALVAAAALTEIARRRRRDRRRRAAASRAGDPTR